MHMRNKKYYTANGLSGFIYYTYFPTDCVFQDWAHFDTPPARVLLGDVMEGAKLL